MYIYIYIYIYIYSFVVELLSECLYRHVNHFSGYSCRITCIICYTKHELQQYFIKFIYIRLYYCIILYFVILYYIILHLIFLLLLIYNLVKARKMIRLNCRRLDLGNYTILSERLVNETDS